MTATETGLGDSIRARHQHTASDESWGVLVCSYDFQKWPCDASRAAQRIDFLEGREAQLQGLADRWAVVAATKQEQSLHGFDGVAAGKLSVAAQAFRQCAEQLRQSLQQNNDEKGV